MIDTDSVWTADGSPYLIDGHVLLAADTLLQIEPGVVVRFLENYHFYISGRLLAEGTADASIRFMPDVPSGDWEELWFTQFATDNSILRYCTFEAGGVTTVCDMPNTNPPTMTFNNFEDKVKLTRGAKGCDIRLFFGITQKEHIKELQRFWDFGKHLKKK